MGKSASKLIVQLRKFLVYPKKLFVMPSMPANEERDWQWLPTEEPSESDLQSFVIWINMSVLESSICSLCLVQSVIKVKKKNK